MEVTFVNSVEFCTQNDLRYNATCGDSVTLECSAKNYDVLRWSKGQSNTAIDLSETHVSMNGTNLRISPVSVEDRGEYKCIAENKYFTAQDISATLEVYCEYLPSLPPSLPPSLFHAYTCMHVLRVCYMHTRICTVHACTVHVQYMHVHVCMYTIGHTCIYVCIRAYTYVAHMHTHIRTYRAYVYACVHVYMHIYVYAVYTCMCMHVRYMHM